MLIKESIWIKNTIESISLSKNCVVLNFGSQNIKYNQLNHHLIKNVINPLLEKTSVKNLDIQTGDGIDYSGDICDDTFFEYMSRFKFDLILLNNLLEHVQNIELVAKRISLLLKENGHLIFTGPFEFPVHYDPIDNGFRPRVQEVVELFPDLRLIIGEIITDYNYSYYLQNEPYLLIKTLFRLVTPFYKYFKWRHVFLPNWKWFNRNYKVTCVLFRKEVYI